MLKVHHKLGQFEGRSRFNDLDFADRHQRSPNVALNGMRGTRRRSIGSLRCEMTGVDCDMLSSAEMEPSFA
jgi:hypothetical protein